MKNEVFTCYFDVLVANFNRRSISYIEFIFIFEVNLKIFEIYLKKYNFSLFLNTTDITLDLSIKYRKCSLIIKLEFSSSTFRSSFFDIISIFFLYHFLSLNFLVNLILIPMILFNFLIKTFFLLKNRNGSSVSTYKR